MNEYLLILEDMLKDNVIDSYEYINDTLYIKPKKVIKHIHIENEEDI
jgi:hypothetical protein